MDDEMKKHQEASAIVEKKMIGFLLDYAPAEITQNGDKTTFVFEQYKLTVNSISSAGTITLQPSNR